MKQLLDVLHRAHVLYWIVLVLAATGVALLFLRSVEEMSLDIPRDAFTAATFKAGRPANTDTAYVLLSFKDGTTDAKRSDLKKKYGLTEHGYVPEIDMHQFEVPVGETAVGISARLAAEGIVDFAEPDATIEPSLAPNDAWYVNWQKNKTQVGLERAWDVTQGTPSVIVAVADTGVNCTHEDLRSVCVTGVNLFDKTQGTQDVQGHGTAVAGVIGAVGNNSVGVAGTAWQVGVMPLVVSNAAGSASYSTIASAITYAADHGVRVVNNSYQSGGSSAVQKAAKYLASKGGVLVVSEGNYGKDTGLSQNPYIVSVGAVDPSDARYSWSSYGADVDVVAPGCTGATTAVGGAYGSFCGTSSAAGEVSGLIALMFSVNPALQPADVNVLLMQSAVDLGAPGADTQYGYGRIDAGRAVTLAQSYTPGVTTSTPQTKPGRK